MRQNRCGFHGSLRGSDRQLSLPKRLRRNSWIHAPEGMVRSLLEELSEIIGLQVYTQNGVFLGNVNNLVVDVDNGAVDGIFIGETNPLLVEGSRAVSVPYRWVPSVGGIVVLRDFPERGSLPEGQGPPPLAAGGQQQSRLRPVRKRVIPFGSHGYLDVPGEADDAHDPIPSIRGRRAQPTPWP